MFPKRLSFLILIAALCLAGDLLVHADDHSPPVRIMTVVIVQQDAFLQTLLKPYLDTHPMNVSYRTGHHRDVVQAVRRGEVDLVMVHTKIKAMDKLTGEGLLEPGHAVFSNPKAFIGPKGDPAKLAGISDPIQAMRQIQKSGKCFVLNPHGLLETLQRDYLKQLDKPCLIDTASNTEAALGLAVEHQGYTLWGLHPFMAKSTHELEPVVVPHPELRQDIGVWVVAHSDNQSEAKKLAEYLTDPLRGEDISKFRLKNLSQVQPWWPPVNR